MSDPADDTRFMDTLLFRSLKRQTTDSEEETVLAWRRADPENEAQYRELERLLELTADAYASLDTALGEPPAGAELLAQAGVVAGRGADEGPGTSFERSRTRRWWGRASLVAGLAVAVAIAGLVLLPAAPPQPESLSFGADELVTGVADVATVHLRDGTLVRLAPSSRLRITGSLGAREVALDGRAFFAVAKRDGHPFTVRTRAGDAVVLGTRFDAEARGDEVRLVVVEGRVALSAAGSSIELGGGQMGRAVEGALSAPVPVPDVQRELEWMGNFLVFQRTPVERVASEIERHFGIRVEVLGTDLDEHTVTASFAERTAEDVLRVVCKVLDARCSVGPQTATIDLTHTAPPARSSRL